MTFGEAQSLARPLSDHVATGVPAWVYVGPTPSRRRGGAGAADARPAPAQRPADAPTPKRILAVKLADVGDTLLITPALSAVGRHFPDAELDALVTPTGADVLRRSSLVRELIEFEARGSDRGRALPGPGPATALWRSLRERHYDMVLLFHHLTTRTGTAKHAALAMSTGATVRAGLARAGSRRAFFLTHSAPDLGFDGAHEVEAALSVAAAVGAGASTSPVRADATLELSPEGREHLQLIFSPGMEAVTRAEELLAQSAALAESPGARDTGDINEAGASPARPEVRFVAIHPGTGAYSPARRWTAGAFAQVAAAASARGFVPVLVGTAGDGTDGVAQLLTVPALDLSGRTDLATLGAVLARCRALVCNDGGVMHLATAMGTPTVAVFGPSNPIAWGPWPSGPGSPHRVVALNLPCRPCFYVEHRLGARHGCPTRDCLTWLKPEWVVRALDEVLASGNPLPATSSGQGAASRVGTSGPAGYWPN